MNIVQFLDEVGQTKLTFQYLHECIAGAKKIGRRNDGAVEVRFGTKEMAVSDVISPQRIGVIVWMDREEFERAQNVAHPKEKS
jgi:hypothetical protein